MAPTSGPVSGAGAADTQQLYGSTALVFWWRPAATRSAGLALALCFPVATRGDRLRRPCDRTVFSGGDPRRPAPPALRSHRVFRWRPAATGSAGLAVAPCFPVATRGDRLRRPCGRTVFSGGDPRRPAPPALRSHRVFRWRPAATGSAGLAVAPCFPVATRGDRLRRPCGRTVFSGGDPRRPAPPALRSHRVFRWRPAATGSAGLAVAPCFPVATRGDRLRRPCGRTVFSGGDPRRPAPPALRSHRVFRWRPAATGSAGLAVAPCFPVATRGDRLRRPCGRTVLSACDPQRHTPTCLV